MSITLTPELEADVLSRVSNGRFADPVEVLTEALRLLSEREKQIAYRVSIKEALDQVERGNFIELTPESMQRLVEESIEEEALGLPLSADVLP